MTKNTAVINDWMKDIQKVAKRASVDWPDVIEQEDLEHEIYLHILESPGTERNLAEMDCNDRYRTLHKIAQRIASRERVDYERFSGNFRFSVEEVRALLEAAGDPEVISLGSSWSTGDYTRSGGGHSDSTAAAAISNLRVSDAQKQLRAALEALKASNPRQYEALVSRFVDGKIPEDKASLMVITRALVSLTTKMNHGHKREHAPAEGALVPNESLGDGPGTRKAVSNSTARYLSKESYDADYMPAPAHLRDNHIEKEVWE